MDIGNIIYWPWETNKNIFSDTSKWQISSFNEVKKVMMVLKVLTSY